jgi:glycosyltransferase involved in cell wall biosynthesis
MFSQVGWLVKASKVSCIICAYNEAARIAEVLGVAAEHPLLEEVIVVDDGSTDDTANIVRSFPSARLISHAENLGKSRALATGIRAAKNDYVMQLDADLKHLTAANITQLAEPVLSGQCDMSISVRKNSLAIYRWLGLDFVSGERVVAKEIVAECLAEIEKLPRFGVEVFMNRCIIKQRLKIAIVRFENVINTRKTEKMGWWRGTYADCKTVLDVLKVVSPFEIVLQNFRMLTVARKNRPVQVPHSVTGVLDDKRGGAITNR